MSHGATSRSFDRGELFELDTEKLRDDFRALRRRRNLRQADVSAPLRVSQATISSFEQGKHHQIRSKTLHGIRDIVAFWKRENASGSPRSGAKRGIVERRELGAQTEVRCAQCGVRMPDLRTPAVFCPSCGAHIRGSCDCGHPLLDPKAGYCSRCGEAVKASNPRVLQRDDGEFQIALLKSVLRWIERGDPAERILQDLTHLASHAKEP